MTTSYRCMTTGIYIKSAILAHSVSLDSGLYHTEKRNIQCRVGRLLMIFPPLSQCRERPSEGPAAVCRSSDAPGASTAAEVIG